MEASLLQTVFLQNDSARAFRRSSKDRSSWIAQISNRGQPNLPLAAAASAADLAQMKSSPGADPQERATSSKIKRIEERIAELEKTPGEDVKDECRRRL